MKKIFSFLCLFMAIVAMSSCSSAKEEKGTSGTGNAALDNIFERKSVPGLISCLIETESHASHLITGFLQPHGGHGTIRATTHAKQYTFI